MDFVVGDWLGARRPGPSHGTMPLPQVFGKPAEEASGTSAPSSATAITSTGVDFGATRGAVLCPTGSLPVARQGVGKSLLKKGPGFLTYPQSWPIFACALGLRALHALPPPRAARPLNRPRPLLRQDGTKQYASEFREVPARMGGHFVAGVTARLHGLGSLDSVPSPERRDHHRGGSDTPGGPPTAE